MEKPILDDLHYIEEHLTCNHYMANIGLGFLYREYDPGDIIIHENLTKNHLLFVLEGSCMLNYNQFNDRMLQQSEMLLLARGGNAHGAANSHLKIIDMIFSVPLSGCDQLILQNYASICTTLHYDFQPITIRYPLSAYLDLLAYCLKNGMQCAHFHDIKHRELFFYLRGFYTKEETALLFYPIITGSLDFRAFVYDNTSTHISLDELIIRSNMSPRNFRRKFLEEFNETPYRWMLKQMQQKIIFELTKPDTTISDIVAKFDFSSQSSFTRFCKSHFGCTPSELFKKYRRVEGAETKI